MNQSFNAVMLAGGIRPSPLRRQLGQPVLTLPVTHDDTLFHLWLETLQATDRCESITIVVSSSADAALVREQFAELNGAAASLPHTRVIVEPAKWRGTAGIVCDVMTGHHESEMVLLIEAVCLPPPSLTKLLRSAVAGAPATVAIAGHAEPAGVYALRPDALRHVPAVGFFDMKEQLLPALSARGCGASAVRIADHVIRLRDRAGYLRAVAHACPERRRRFGSEADTGRNHAKIVGHTLICPDVTVEPGAVVHDSVLLRGATIRRGAIVSRSIIGGNFEVPAGEVVKDAVARGRPRRWGASRRSTGLRDEVAAGATWR